MRRGVAASGSGGEGEGAAAVGVRVFPPGLILFTYLHLAPLPELTEALLEARVSAVAYETIREQDGSLPLLTPMSEVAGRMAVQVGAQYLERPNGGRGILLGGVPGVAPANVVVIGGGVVGHNAAKMAWAWVRMSRSSTAIWTGCGNWTIFIRIRFARWLRTRYTVRELCAWRTW